MRRFVQLVDRQRARLPQKARVRPIPKANERAERAARGAGAPPPLRMVWLPVNVQYRLAGACAAVGTLGLIAGFLLLQPVTGTLSKYGPITTQLQVLSQAIANSAQQAAIGNTAAFDPLIASEQAFSGQLALLAAPNSKARRVGKEVSAAIDDLVRDWEVDRALLAAIVLERPRLEALKRTYQDLSVDTNKLFAVSEWLSTLAAQHDDSQTTLSFTNNLTLLAQRMATNLLALAFSDLIDPEVSFLIRRDRDNFGRILQGFVSGDEKQRIAKMSDPDSLRVVSEAQVIFSRFEARSRVLTDSVGKIAEAKTNARKLFGDSDRLSAGAKAVGEGLKTLELRRSRWSRLAIYSAIVAAIGIIGLALVKARQSAFSAWEAKQKYAADQALLGALHKEMLRMSAGDLRVRPQASPGSVGTIASLVGVTASALSQTVASVTLAAAEVDQAAAAALVHMDDLLSAASRESAAIRRVAGEVRSVNDAVGEVDETGSEVERLAMETRDVVQRGGNAILEAVRSAEETRSGVHETSKRVKRMIEQLQTIPPLTVAIRNLSERVNVLALNAAVQAANAGDLGKGFAVVAAEIKKLADLTSGRSDEIASIAAALRSAAGAAVESIDSSTHAVTEGAGLCDAASVAFARIENTTRDLTGRVQLLREASRHQSESADLASESAKELEESNASASSLTTRAAASVKRISELATTLRGSVSQFKVEKSAATNPRVHPATRARELHAALPTTIR